MKAIYLLTGSNTGNKRYFLDLAIKEIKRFAIVRQISSVYLSEPWGFKSKNFFLNQCLEIDFSLDPFSLLKMLKEIEKKTGRAKSETYSDRNLDIDILYYGSEIINEKDLIIPHPRLHLRAFTLFPLHDIAPSFIHPVLEKTTEQLLRDCPDKSLVKKARTN